MSCGCDAGDSSLVTAVRFWDRCLRRSMRGTCPSEDDPAADFERGEAVAVCQLIGTGTGDPEHRSDLCDGEHQRQLVIACVGGMLHCAFPFSSCSKQQIHCGQLALDLLPFCCTFDRRKLARMKNFYGFTDRPDGVAQVAVLLDAGTHQDRALWR